jgi:hypothetical protein
MVMLIIEGMALLRRKGMGGVFARRGMQLGSAAGMVAEPSKRPCRRRKEKWQAIH